VNGQPVSHDVEDNMLLVTYLRETLALTGTHIGCDTSQCGACVIHINGASAKSCTVLAVQAEGKDITTIEGIASGDKLHPMQ
jgi:carbon-monoxide dehydrogenase small subunit